jgi:DNA-directed RNA polymerase specialized sigma24 family protein
VTVEITQDHIDFVFAIAGQLSRSVMGGWAGADELQSEALVVLWDLAVSWDEDGPVPFRAYLAMNVQRKLIDWLRSEYGRAGAKGQSKLRFTLGVQSLDGLYEARAFVMPSRSPSVETIVEDRETLAEATRIINNEHTGRQRDALLWPLQHDSSESVERKWAMSRDSVSATRYQAKELLRRALDNLMRPPP